MEIVPLFGSSFAVYAPIITAIVGAITFLNVYARILKFIGIQDEDSVTVGEFCGRLSESEKEEVESGKKLVNGALRTLSNILIAENRASASKDIMSLLPFSRTTRNNENSDTEALGADFDADGDVELAGDDDDNLSPRGGDMTAWGRDSPSSSSFYSSFKTEKKEDDLEPPPKEEKGFFSSWKSKESKPVSTSSSNQLSNSSDRRNDRSTYSSKDTTTTSSKSISSVSSPTTTSATASSSLFSNSNSNSKPKSNFSSNEKEYKGSSFSSSSSSSTLVTTSAPKTTLGSSSSTSTSINSNTTKATPAPAPSSSSDPWGSTGGGWDIPTTAHRGGRYG
eukprot:CAMPEP_0174826342 /NCGR_PEP_ID=MMETSP1107-20130205/43868_1 /TAXON_ID=36770 /ORGANISM="Paraphysomonas vestita, Strain GFlagA" /LENGTH=335 /DNA_ID=CAMNT_0016059267 /DNA_START=1459 /DNA_END=2469 /DNA_ORIENTATION=-